MKPTIKKIIVVTAICIGMLAAAAVVWLAGGIRPAFGGLLPTPNPKSSTVISKREKAENEISQDFASIENAITVSGNNISRYDSCYKGQNNYKVHEGYSNRCETRITEYYGSNMNFRQAMLTLHETLIHSGWNSRERDSLPYYITEYYDTGRAISELPYVHSGYTKAGKTIAIAYSDKDTRGLYNLESAQGFSMRGSPYYEDKQFQDIQTLYHNLIMSNEYVVSISITGIYIEN